MKLNSTYYSKDTKRQVIEKLGFLNKTLEKKINEAFTLLKVSTPVFLERNSDLLIDNSLITRNISFDSGSKGSINTLTNDNSLWFTKILKDYEIKDEEGIYSHEKSIWRDVVEKPTKALVNDEIIIEIKVKKGERKTDEKVREYTKIIYQIISSLSRTLSKEFGGQVLFVDPFLEYASSQILENLYPELSFIEREKVFATDNHSFVLENPGQKLFSNKYHYDENPLLYDTKNQSVIIINNKINNYPVKVAKISLRARGETLEKQLQLFSRDEYKENKFVNSIIKKEYPLSIQIKIDKLALALVLLNKGHIKELLPDFGDSTDIKKDIKKRINTL